MPQPIPYLAFDGQCAAAMRFYEQALGARLAILMTNGDSPIAEHCSPGSEDRILHACLEFADGGSLMAGDCPAHAPFTGQQGVALTLNYDTVAEAERVFHSLAAGGKVTMPLQPTFWARIWGMVVDRFGTSWIVNGERLPF